MLRIRFSTADLTRVTLAPRPDQLWEVLLSLHALQAPRPEPHLARWRADVATGPKVRALARLAPPRGYSPDFLTPGDAEGGLASGLDAVRRTPSRRLSAELCLLGSGQTPPAWARRLAAGDRHELVELTAGLGAYHRQALVPHWERIEKVVDDEVVARTRVLATRGTDEFLGSLHPALTWRNPVLELAGDHVTGELDLAGRGLRLVPAYFCRQAPTLLADPGLPPVLIYPADPERRRPPASAAPADPAAVAALADLLGGTRATALRAIGDGCTTTELSRRLGLSASAASYHATILRSSGLITTERVGPAVTHQLTVLGSDLLSQGRARR